MSGVNGFSGGAPLPPGDAGPPPAWKTWHSDTDIADRRNLIHEILKMFQQRKPSVTKEWQQKLPDFVRRLEEALYRSAASKEEYCNVDTLETRLQAVARRMVARPAPASGADTAASAASAAHGLPGGVQALAGLASPAGAAGVAALGGGAAGGSLFPKAENGGYLDAHGGGAAGAGGHFPAGEAGAMHLHHLGGAPPLLAGLGAAPGGLKREGDPLGSPAGGALGHAGSLAPGMGPAGGVLGNGGVVLRGAPAAGYASLHGMSGGGMGGMGGAPGAGTQQALAAAQQQAMLAQQAMQQQQALAAQQHAGGVGAPGGAAAAAAAAAAAGGAGGLSTADLLKRQELERVYIVKQQRWLLFLRHASKCLAEEGQCPYTPHCHVARKLWEHVLSCQNGACNYPRCVASRELLKHHQRCKEEKCPVCGPVRQAMHKQRQNLVAAQMAAGGAGGAMLTAAQQQQLHLYAQSGHSGGGGGGRSGGGGGKRARTDHYAPAAQPGTQLVERGTTGRARGASGPEGTSLCECFSEEEIRVHLASLRLPEAKIAAGVPMSARRREAESAAVLAAAPQAACKACGVEKLTFEPPPLYCNNCNVRIKPKQTFYLAQVPSQAGEAKQYFCTGCYQGFGPQIEVEGAMMLKSQLAKRKNEEDLEEPWVQCDACQQWVHQICTLFNGRRNEGGESAFTCPSCMLEQMMRAERTPTVNRPSSQQPASSLPRTQLSDYLEQYLTSRLVAERQDRARVLGKAPEEVPGAEGLCIRVVSCVDKRLDVKSQFYRAFSPVGYPDHFQYRSKVLMLYQNIEGVDVCLFCMYVQEYGSDQPSPNNRRIYLSYLDSVKFFRPEVMSARNNEALRTYVYHTILVGYLDYVKRRGFTSCYIWACPPLPGEDYILYCHPTRQKTPKSEKLREWYLKMLATAKQEGIVVSLGNLHDELKLDREATGEMRSAADVPYFDGDYWPGAAEEMIVAVREEESKRRAGAKSGGAAAAKRDRSGKGKRPDRPDGSLEALDAGLMCKLSEQIVSMKNDFIMVHLWYECSRCRKTIEGATRYASRPGEPHYELCEECFGIEQSLPPEERGFRGELVPQLVPALPATKDLDDQIECEFFDTRQAFLSMCQGNKFQFDTLRRAKHSSMMVIFHLHNPTEPAFVATCNLCARELEPGTGWRCETCPDFDVCDECRRYRGHAHELKPQSNRRDTSRAMSKEERQARMLQLQRTMELLVHASACTSAQCQSSNCAKVKTLFQHAFTCQQKATGGCGLCRRMWTLLQVHSKACQKPNCPVPRCRDLKEYRRRAEEHQEERRRQAFAHYRQLQATGS